MANNPQEELEEMVAQALWDEMGNTFAGGIVRQPYPIGDARKGDLLHGVDTLLPFVSVSSILEEQFDEGKSYDHAQHWVRPVTVALYDVEDNYIDNMTQYKSWRFNAMRICNLRRFVGRFVTDPDSCILSSFVRPKSPVSQSALLSHGKFATSFDVRFRTLESRNTVTF